MIWQVLKDLREVSLEAFTMIHTYNRQRRRNWNMQFHWFLELLKDYQVPILKRRQHSHIVLTSLSKPSTSQRSINPSRNSKRRPPSGQKCWRTTVLSMRGVGRSGVSIYCQRLENLANRAMEEVTAKCSELCTVFVFLSTRHGKSNRYPLARVHYSLFGFARKARGVTAFRWARRTLLWTSPLDMYNGWYSLWPVPTETVVLSLPRKAGQKVEPWFLGSFTILS